MKFLLKYVTHYTIESTDMTSNVLVRGACVKVNNKSKLRVESKTDQSKQISRKFRDVRKKKNNNW